MDRKKIYYVMIGVLIALILGLSIIFLLVKSDEAKKNEEDEKKSEQEETLNNINKMSDSLINIVGGVYYSDGFNITQTKENGTVLFHIFITNPPFAENGEKGIKWLESQGLDLSKASYQCTPSRFVEATEEEMASCTSIK